MLTETEGDCNPRSDLEKGKKYKFDFPTVQDELEFGHETDEKTQGDKMYKFKGKERLLLEVFLKQFLLLAKLFLKKLNPQNLKLKQKNI